MSGFYSTAFRQPISMPGTNGEQPPLPAALVRRRIGRLLLTRIVWHPQLASAQRKGISYKGSERRNCQMRTLTGYGIAVVIVFAILNGIFWLVDKGVRWEIGWENCGRPSRTATLPPLDRAGWPLVKCPF
jgi:hypothetical protein